VLDDEEHKVFRYHYLLGADWKLCCRQLQVDRGMFFHTVYRIQRKLGKAFAELEPYPLYPLADYFAGVLRNKAVPCMPEVRRQRERAVLPLSA
jgi:hypothetical protein